MPPLNLWEFVAWFLTWFLKTPKAGDELVARNATGGMEHVYLLRPCSPDKSPWGEWYARRSQGGEAIIRPWPYGDWCRTWGGMP